MPTELGPAKQLSDSLCGHVERSRAQQRANCFQLAPQSAVVLLQENSSGAQRRCGGKRYLSLGHQRTVAALGNPLRPFDLLATIGGQGLDNSRDRLRAAVAMDF